MQGAVAPLHAPTRHSLHPLTGSRPAGGGPNSRARSGVATSFAASACALPTTTLALAAAAHTAATHAAAAD